MLKFSTAIALFIFVWAGFASADLLCAKRSRVQNPKGYVVRSLKITTGTKCPAGHTPAGTLVSQANVDMISTKAGVPGPQGEPGVDGANGLDGLNGAFDTANCYLKQGFVTAMSTETDFVKTGEVRCNTGATPEFMVNYAAYSADLPGLVSISTARMLTSTTDPSDKLPIGISVEMRKLTSSDATWTGTIQIFCCPRSS